MGDDTGLAAVEALDGFDHLGRNLRVSQAHPREDSEGPAEGAAEETSTEEASNEEAAE